MTVPMLSGMGRSFSAIFVQSLSFKRCRTINAGAKSGTKTLMEMESAKNSVGMAFSSIINAMTEIRTVKMAAVPIACLSQAFHAMPTNPHFAVRKCLCPTKLVSSKESLEKTREKSS